MNAKPHPGLRGVGGATPHPGAALTDEMTESTRPPPRELPALPPFGAVHAALSWHANRTIARQVDVAYAMADLARAHGRALARSAESSLPECPLRDALTAAANAYVECADHATRAAARFGRHFGHLAFAFPRPN